MLRGLLIATLFCACAPAIRAPALTATARQDTPEVSACLLIGERSDKPLAMGLDTLSLAPWHLAIASVLVRRGDEWLIIDPSFGAHVHDDLAVAPPWFGALVAGSADTKTPLPDLLERIGLSPREVRHVLLTHAHWDHAGGLRELPNAKIHLSSAEWDFVRALRRRFESGAMRHQFEGLDADRFAPFDAQAPGIAGFAGSKDLFADGTIIAVPLPGHTPGSTGYLLRLTGGQQVLLIGDAAWTAQGVAQPAHKNAIARLLLDSNSQQTADTLGTLHAFQKANPDVAVLPAHDYDALKVIPECKPAASAPATAEPAP